MKRLIVTLTICIITSLLCSAALAAQVRVYVEPFNVTGAKDKEELKSALQVLLASRVSNDQVIAVDKAADADLVVSGSYLAFGPVYSLDAAARDKSGKVVARAFEQGEDMNQLIPTVARLGKKLGDEIGKLPASQPAMPAVATLPVMKPATPEIVRKEAPKPAEPEFIKPQEIEKNSGNGWTSPRLSGSMVGIAPGRTLPDGRREFFVVNDNLLRLYQLGDSLKMSSEVSFKSHEKILGVDTADLDGDGNPEAYVTIMDRESLQSQVWIARDGRMQRVADRLPYYFRAIALAGGPRKIYVQQIGTDADFYGDVAELVRTGERYETKDPFKLPRFGYLYNFNMFTDEKGQKHYLVFSEDGYLLVYSADGEELWKSSDKFGGSETYFKREDINRIRFTGDQFRWKFLEQRMFVTKDGEIIVPKNSGTFVIGNQRTFNKNSVYSFAWNGSSLEEKWHTRETPQYLSDFFYDEARRELVLLQVVKKDGIIKEGASTIAIKKLE